MCNYFKMPRSSYYKWIQNKENKSNLVIAEMIGEIQKAVKYTYDYKRIKEELLFTQGLVINHKTVLRLMQKYNLFSVIRHKYLYKNSFAYNKYENLFNRNFTATGINQKWCTDISCIKTEAGMLYLSVIKDCFDSSIVVYRHSTSMSMNLVTQTIKDAVKKERINGTQIHSDQGFQYTSKEYLALTKECKLTPSMSRAGTPLDNAPVESFFETLKCECLYRQKIKKYKKQRI